MALPDLGKQIKGIDLHDAVLTGIETRTSSPLRITLGTDMQSLNVFRLYPPTQALQTLPVTV